MLTYVSKFLGGWFGCWFDSCTKFGDNPYPADASRFGIGGGPLVGTSGKSMFKLLGGGGLGGAWVGLGGRPGELGCVERFTGGEFPGM